MLGNISEYFDSYMGVKKGVTIHIYINDLKEDIKYSTTDLVTLDQVKKSILLFQGDTLLFSNTISGHIV